MAAQSDTVQSTTAHARGVIAAFAITSLLLLLAYALTRSHLYNIDGMGYAKTIAAADSVPFSSGSHILYPAFGYALSHLLHSDPLLTLQWANILAGVIGGILFAILAVRMLHTDRWTAAALTLCLCFSYGYWVHATDAEDTMLPTCFLFASALAALEIRSLLLRTCTAGVLIAIAILFQANFILGLIPLVTLELTNNAPRSRRLLSAASLISVTALVLAISIFLIARYGVNAHSMEDAGAWLGAGAQAQAPVWGNVSAKSLAKACYGLLKSFIAFPIGYERLSTFLHSSTAVEKGIWIAGQLLLAGLLAYTFLRGVLFAISRTRNRKSLREALHEYRFELVTAAWILSFGTFAAFWAPGDVEFWVPVIPAVWLVACGLYCKCSRGNSRRLVFSILAVTCFLFNFQQSLCPASLASNNPFLQRVSQLRDLTSPGDVFVTPGSDWIATYVEYFAERPVIDLEVLTKQHGSSEAAKMRSKDIIQETLRQGHTVYVGSLWGNDNDTFWEFLNPIGLTKEDLRDFFGQFENTRHETLAGCEFLVIESDVETSKS